MSIVGLLQGKASFAASGTELRENSADLSNPNPADHGVTLMAGGCVAKTSERGHSKGFSQAYGQRRLVRHSGPPEATLGVVESSPFGVELDVSAFRGVSDTLVLFEE